MGCIEVNRWIRQNLSNIPKDENILDIGAGQSQYQDTDKFICGSYQILARKK